MTDRTPASPVEPFTPEEEEDFRTRLPRQHNVRATTVARLLAAFDLERNYHEQTREALNKVLEVREAEYAAVSQAQITGLILAKAWVMSGRTAPLIEPDEWDGFALTVRAVAALEPTHD